MRILKLLSLLVDALSLYFCNGYSSNELWTEGTVFEISGNKVEGKSYVVGVRHSQSPNTLPHFHGINQLFNETECLITETDIGNADFNRYIAKYKNLIFLPRGTSYSEILSAEQYYLIDDYLYYRGIGRLSEQRYNPLMLEFLLRKIDNQVTDADSIHIEEYFYRQAEVQSKRYVYLEEFNYQVEQLMFIFQKVIEKTNLQTTSVQLQSLIDYINSPRDSLYITEIDDKTIDETFNCLEVSERNQRWFRTIKRTIRRRSSFIVVGKGHLLGKEGVINLLEESGYEIKRIY